MGQERRVPILNGQLHVERTGSGPPVVLLHAGFLDTSMWDDQVESFAAGHTVIRFDARSHGRSSTASLDYRPEDDLLALLDYLDIARASLVGNSHGGATAMTFALRYPERVERLVLAGPGITPMEFHDPFVLDQYQEQAAARAAGDADRYVEAFLRYGVDGPYRRPSEVSPRIRQRCHDMALRTVRRHHTATGTILEHDTVSALERIAVPTRIIMGELELSDLHRITDTAAERMPFADKIVMAGRGHMMNMEQPMRFNELALEHLASLPDGEELATPS